MGKSQRKGEGRASKIENWEVRGVNETLGGSGTREGLSYTALF